MILLEDVRKAYGTIRALDGLSLTVPEGKVYGLIGPNGAGKTTTIRILAGLARPDSGRVLLNGQATDQAGETRRLLGALIEQPGLYGRLTLREYLTFFARLHDLGREAAAARIDELLELLELEDWRDERLHGFSLGMKQKVSLARILLHDPPILLLDEPTAGLDPLITKKVRDHLLGQGRQARKTVLVSTHNLDEASRVCDEIAVIHRGRIVEAGAWHELRARHGGGGVVMLRVRNLRDEYEALIRSAPGTSRVTVDRGRRTLRFLAPAPEVTNPHLISRLVEAGAEIVSVEVGELPLEQAYLKLIGEGVDDPD